ncbi:hypothetical protein F5Y07DRAFT_396721 [Xylaria sp. FL0933]|nr:hypothetical protein F5Y07DRAFT_396721 [Xylaria sp. FL0933]
MESEYLNSLCSRLRGKKTSSNKPSDSSTSHIISTTDLGFMSTGGPNMCTTLSDGVNPPSILHGGTNTQEEAQLNYANEILEESDELDEAYTTAAEEVEEEDDGNTTEELQRSWSQSSHRGENPLFLSPGYQTAQGQHQLFVDLSVQQLDESARPSREAPSSGVEIAMNNVKRWFQIIRTKGPSIILDGLHYGLYLAVLVVAWVMLFFDMSGTEEEDRNNTHSYADAARLIFEEAWQTLASLVVKEAWERTKTWINERN